MKSLNFEALRPHYTELADLGGFAEQYVHSDPAAAVVKIRIFGEALIHAIYERYKLRRPFERHFKALLSASTFESIVPPSILSKFDAVRLEGNPGAHPGPVTQATARKLLREAYDLGKWWAMLALKADLVSLPEFKIPPVQPSLPFEVQNKLKEQEQLLEKTIAELENLRKQYHEVTQKDTQLKVLRKEGQESADLVRLMPDERGVERGVRLFSYLAQEANQAKAVGISYAGFIAYLHGVDAFHEVIARNYLPSDSGPVIRIAMSITAKAGGRKQVGGPSGHTIEAGMDTFIWQKEEPFKRSDRAFQSRHQKLPYSQREWLSVFPDGRRRMITAEEIRQLSSKGDD
jgi:hypothetical protein